MRVTKLILLSKYIKRSILSNDKCCFCYIFVGFKLTAKIAIINLISYIKLGGYLLVKSNQLNEEEYNRYVLKSTRKKFEYEPNPSYGAAELRKMRKQDMELNRYNRLIPKGLDIDGHVGLCKIG